MIYFFFVLAVSLTVVQDTSAQEKQLTQDQLSEGWIQLFDGQTLYGWEATSDANWRVIDGEIHVDEGEAGFLMTTTRWANYQLRVQFKAPEPTNSGIFLRTPREPSDPSSDCYELNIAPPDNPFPTGSLVGRAKSSTQVEPADRWRTFDIVVDGTTVEVRLDGKKVLSYEDPTGLQLGRIGLQFREGEVRFRNIYLKPLGTKSIFNSEDLTGWNTDRAEESRFEVTQEGELRVLDGRGQLESQDKYGDFVLQLECKTNGDNLNSGIFFRSIPGDFMNGYEAQIHNGYREGDRSKPVDYGTGGIFRRQEARRVMADDHQWFSMTILADGPHIATWVNGVQVTDWKDRRPPHENPRQGLRLVPGTLCIQGHDPTTDLLFRNIRIATLPRSQD